MGNFLNKDTLSTISKKKICLYLLGAYAIYKISKYLKQRSNEAKLKKKGEALYNERSCKFYKFKEVSNAEFILSLDVTQLRRELSKKAFSCEDLVHVYAQRCFNIGRSLSLTTEELFEEAFVMA
jgi:hypothetical protein